MTIPCPLLSRLIIRVVSLILISCPALAQIPRAAETQIDAPSPPSGIWSSQPPAGCPFAVSDTFSALTFTGRHAEYTNADTWYPSWAADGNLYSPFTDGSVNGVGISSAGENAGTGQAVIIGDDPLNLKVENPTVFHSSPRPYEGRYPCGSLVHDGIWYYGTYCLHPSGGVNRDGMIYNWPWLGPFAGFRTSSDLGKTWTETALTPAQPLFGESALNGEPVKIGAPHFVDFGRNMQYSPDGKAYLVAHGASNGANRRFAYNSWITADEIYLVRVKPTPQTINDVSQYEFFCGHDSTGQPIWTGDFARIQPIATWKDNMGCVTMTYNPPLKKYFLCVTDGGNTVSRYNTYILESDRITGPWKLAVYMKDFGQQAYFVNIPSKFISPDGRSFWLCYAANFSSGWGGTVFYSRPAGSRYAMCLQEVRLINANETQPRLSPLEQPANIASLATLSVSSTHGDYNPAGLTDGWVEGFPGDIKREWCSNGEKESALIRLTWKQPQTIDRVWLFDRPNDLDQILSGVLIFSDGSMLKTGPLPDNAEKGLEVRFPAKTVTWMLFLPETVKPASLNIGLAEIAVFAVEKP